MSDKKNNRKRKRLPMDMRTRGRKKKKAPAKIDYLTNLPPEIFLEILSNTPLASFLSLAQTHSHLRWFMHRFAATICNINIEARFPTESKLLGATKIEGWLTPTDRLIKIPPMKGSRWVDPGLQLLLSAPGPQFLFFLEKKVLTFSAETVLMVECKAMQEFMSGLNEESPVVYGGKDYPRWCWLKEMIWYHGAPS
jgi:hypothetical protein